MTLTANTRGLCLLGGYDVRRSNIIMPIVARTLGACDPILPTHPYIGHARRGYGGHIDHGYVTYQTTRVVLDDDRFAGARWLDLPTWVHGGFHPLLEPPVFGKVAVCNNWFGCKVFRK